MIKPADKNLGLVVLNTSDYEAMCLTHLSDKDTYTPVPHFSSNHIYAKLRIILNNHHVLYKDANASPPTLTKLASSLLQLQNNENLRIAPIYCLPKLHKGIHAMPIPSRLIMPALLTATAATSEFLDRELQPILKLLKGVCTSSRHVIRDFYGARLPADCVFLCADVASLYPSIPIDFGIKAVKHTCQVLNCFPEAKLNLILDLLYWVLSNNFCTFKNVVYHQTKGTAIGTPAAVSYANIVLYDMEHPILERLRPSFYRRYIDDLLSALTRQLARELVDAFNAINSSIQLEAVTIGDTDCVFLDLAFTLQYDDSFPFCTVSHKLYQKPINKYQYIPYMSYHQPHVFSNFITQELKRYLLACSYTADFKSLVSLFQQRLARRGYPPHLVDDILPTLPTRASLLDSLISSTANARPKTPTKPPPIITLSVPKLYPDPDWRQVFKIPPDLTAFVEYKAAFGKTNTIIGHKNPPSIATFIVSSTHKR